MCDLAKLETFLLDKSYLSGCKPSNADLAAFEAIPADAAASAGTNVQRWYRHIKSFSADEQKAFSGAKTILPHLVAAPAKNDDDFDLFGDEDEDEEAKALKEANAKKAEEKKKAKPEIIQKSMVVFNVKPWDDTTNLDEMQALVRGIAMDGLVWGESKYEDVAFGIKMLTIAAIVEDLKVSTQDVEDTITAFEDHVQSVDIASFNKV